MDTDKIFQSKPLVRFNSNSEVGLYGGRSVVVLGHSNMVCGAFENISRLGCCAMLRPRTGALRGRL